jgi:transcriptional regulator with XRE-family HTH domain
MKMTKYIEKSPVLVDFGNRIKMLRLGKGWNQFTFATNCKMEKSSMSKIESGLVNVSLLTMHRMSSCLGITMMALFAA